LGSGCSVHRKEVVAAHALALLRDAVALASRSGQRLEVEGMGAARLVDDQSSCADFEISLVFPALVLHFPTHSCNDC
jgi:hypothetical protein